MKKQDRYASTGVKFWRHEDQLLSYQMASGRTAISTHISPEGACNLSCRYCSVRNRGNAKRLPLWVIERYVDELMSRGLKAVIITGGGEPTLYPQFNTLVSELRQRGLKIGLITNGTLGQLVEPQTWRAFTWVRVSLNLDQNREKPINVSSDLLDPRGVYGLSMVVELHEGDAELQLEALHKRWMGLLEGAQGHADKLGAKYIRVLPDCMPGGTQLRDRYSLLASLVDGLNDDRFFVHERRHRAPNCTTCHQSYFRPYLSEMDYVDKETGVRSVGSVYPCDALVLNSGVARFEEKFQVCKPGDVLDYLDHRILPTFNPIEDCSECLFADSVEMLGRWERYEEDFRSVGQIEHEDFV